MKKIPTKEERVNRFLVKLTRKNGWNFSDLTDSRKEGKVTHSIHSIIWALELGMMANMPTLRDIEDMTSELGGWARRLVSAKISDTTIDTEVRRLDQEALLAKLVSQIRDMNRSKILKPYGLPCGVATIDGKNLATLDHYADGHAHRRTKDNKKWHKKGTTNTGEPYWLTPVLRSTLTSSLVKPCIYQMALPPGTGESTNFKSMIDALEQSYGKGKMVEIYDGDAAFASLANADYLNNRYQKAYVFGLKGNQGDLFSEANYFLNKKSKEEQPEAQTEWESYGGKRIRRSLWRTDEMQGMETSAGCWKHLRQTWLVRQESLNPETGEVKVEDRFFITSLLKNRLSPEQILLLVRRHWAIENDCFNSLDVQWKEDSGKLCTQGQAVWVLGILRIMAYNVVQYFRKRRLRRKDDKGGWLLPMTIALTYSTQGVLT